MRHNDNWLSNPDYMELVDFLVEKTKNIKTVMNVRELAGEFKNKSKQPASFSRLISRIANFRLVIHEIPYLDTEAKMKLAFGLSASVDQKFLEELRKDAEVEVDDFNRIVHYKKNGGGLEFNGTHNPREHKVSTNQILQFLADKVEETSGIINISKLARQLKAEIGSSQHDNYLQRRFRDARKQIYESELFDEKMKVRMIFATRTRVGKDALKELRKNAFVVVDKKNIIIEYQRKDESLYLNKKEYKLKRGSRSNTVDESDDKEDSNEDVEEKQVDSSNDSEQEEEDLEVATRSGRLSKKRFSVASLFNKKDNTLAAQKKRLESSNNPTTKDKKRKISDYKPGKDEKKKPVVETPHNIDMIMTIRHDHDYSIDFSYQYNEQEEEDLEVTTRSERLSKKSFSVASLFNIKDDMGSSSTRNDKLRSSNNPKTSNKKRKTSEHTNGSVGKRKKEIVEALTTEEEETRQREPEEEYDNDYSFDFSYQNNENTEVKLVPFNGPLNEDTTRLHIINNGENFVEEIPATPENFVAPKFEEMLMDVKLEEPEVIILDDQIDKEIKEEDDIKVLNDPVTLKDPVQQNSTASEDVQKDHTSLTLILQNLNDFIDNSNLPILSDLQKRIQMKLEECKGNSKIEMVSNKELYHYLEVCLLKVDKNWELIELKESFSLDLFLSPFRLAVVHMKCPSLVEFQEKLKGIIGELRVHNKFVPVTAIRSALQSVIDNVINS